MGLTKGLLELEVEEEAGTAEECQPGCVVGEYHFLNQEKRMGNLRAKQDSVVFELTAPVLDRMLQADPYLGYVLARISIQYLGIRCHNVANRIWDTRCLP